MGQTRRWLRSGPRTPAPPLRGGRRGTKRSESRAAVFRRRFWANLVLAVPVFAYSETIQDWLSFTPPSFPGDELVAPIPGTVIFLYGGWLFLAGAASEIRGR